MTADVFYITTAIDYPNGPPHLGHAYERLTTDAIARYQRANGREVFFLTGTDEHGAKVEKAAIAKGLTPKQYTDELSALFREAWDRLDVSYNRFIRTTDADHEQTVLAWLEAVRERGYIEPGVYEGWYCVGCESFKTDKDITDGKCPEHPHLELQFLTEENLFFKLSAFRDPLLKHIRENPGFLEPESRRNEILSLLEEGLNDLSISRQSVDWGVAIPFHPGSTVYVWFDALLNYLTGAGYGVDDHAFARRWPADIHILGKDVTRFHAVIWPAMLMAAGLPLPEKVFGHGWVTQGGAKLSKSAGTDSLADQIDFLGVDALRHELLRYVTFGRDGEFDTERYRARYNAALANELGNLASRILTMLVKHFDAAVPAVEGRDESAYHPFADVAERYHAAMQGLELHAGIEAAWVMVSHLNNLVQQRAPWVIAKDPSRREELAQFLYSCADALRLTAHLLRPFIPAAMADLLGRLGASDELGSPFSEVLVPGRLAAGTPVTKGAPLFPRAK